MFPVILLLLYITNNNIITINYNKIYVIKGKAVIGLYLLSTCYLNRINIICNKGYMYSIGMVLHNIYYIRIILMYYF